MDSPLYTRERETVDFWRQTCTEEGEDGSISRKGHSHIIGAGIHGRHGPDL